MRRQRGMRHPGFLSALAVVAVALVLGAPAWAANLKNARIFLEFNLTDNDLGVQVFLDASAWQSVTITDPNDNLILQIDAHGVLGELGLTELVWESAEPSPEEVLGQFPPGTYTFEVTLVEGSTPSVLTGTATLSHDLPDGVIIVSPVEDGSLDPANAVISWTHPQSNQLAGFEVIVENTTSGVKVADFNLPASATMVQVASQAFAGPGKKYKVEVLAISENGNKTIVEVPFTAQ